MTLQRGLAVYTIFWSPPPSALLQPLTVPHTLLVLCVYTYICIWVTSYSVYHAYTQLVYARPIIVHDHTQRGLATVWVFDQLYMYMHWRTLILDHWLYIALLLWTSLCAFGAGLVIGFIWILFIWAIQIFTATVCFTLYLMIQKIYGL